MPSELTKYGRPVETVFDLSGRGEVDLTDALAWTLHQSPTFLELLWTRVGGIGSTEQVRIDLEVADEHGRTDLEISNGITTVIVEAKKGWLVAEDEQLSRYLPRLRGVSHPLLVSLSDSSAEWTAGVLGTRLADVPIRHVPWDAVRQDLRAALGSVRGAERRWLKELETYLAGATAVRDPSDQWVYCVVVSEDTMGGPRTFRDYVTTERQYFHPYGGRNGWPKRPPTFLAFRWGGQIQQINRVVGSRVVSTLQELWPDIPVGGGTESPHIVHSLGPDIPIGYIPTKGVYVRARVWALLDQILTQPDLAEAVRESKAISDAAH